MKYLLGILIMIWSVFSSAKDYPEVIVGEEDGFVDLTFTISNSKKLESGSYQVVVKGNLKGDKVGFVCPLGTRKRWMALTMPSIGGRHSSEALVLNLKIL